MFILILFLCVAATLPSIVFVCVGLEMVRETLPRRSAVQQPGFESASSERYA